MKVIYNDIIPFKGFLAVNLFGVVFARNKYNPLPDRVLNHEAIHTAQMKERLYVGFYLLYLFEWIVLLLQHRSLDKAYKGISFEREAYENEADYKYLEKRGKFGK